MKFTSKIVKKAWGIYHAIITDADNKLAKRIKKSDAFRQAIKFFTAIKKGSINFFKLAKDALGDTEICTRNIKPIEGFYTAKGKFEIPESYFICWDVDKNHVLKLNHFQIL